MLRTVFSSASCLVESAPLRIIFNNLLFIRTKTPEIPHNLSSGIVKDNESIKKIMSTFLCTKRTAQEIRRQNKKLLTDHLRTSINRAQYLKEEGIKPEMLLNNVGVLEVSKRELVEKIKLLKQWNCHDLNQYLPLLRMSVPVINKCIKFKLKRPDKVSKFTDLFGCSEGEVLNLINKYPFLPTSKITTIEPKINLLVEGGLKKRELIKDLWVLTYTVTKLQERLDKAKSMQLYPIKPWMLRCQEKIIERKWLTNKDDKAALGAHSTTSEFLMSQLNIHPDDIKTLGRKYPGVMRMHLAKLKETIDFLVSEGFTKKQIVKMPKVLCHSLSTIRYRLEVLKACNKNDSITPLCMSKRAFNEYIDKCNSSTSSS